MDSKTDISATHALSYGLFVLTAKDSDRQNGCIVNTCIQVTSAPLGLSITVNKQNYTHDMILKTKKFNVSVLSEKAEFEIFTHFGFKSGRNTEKIMNNGFLPETENGIVYIKEGTNAVMSVNVTKTVDCGTHTIFIGEVTEAKRLSNDRSATYQYYLDHIKPAPDEKKKKGYVCKVCGYVYEGDELPNDFVCPVCKHGAEDFEPNK